MLFREIITAYFKWSKTYKYTSPANLGIFMLKHEKLQNSVWNYGTMSSYDFHTLTSHLDAINIFPSLLLYACADDYVALKLGSSLHKGKSMAATNGNTMVDIHYILIKNC